MTLIRFNNIDRQVGPPAKVQISASTFDSNEKVDAVLCGDELAEAKSSENEAFAAIPLGTWPEKLYFAA